MEYKTDRPAWQNILEFWFPEGRSLQIDAATHQDHWRWRIHGGADHDIRTRFLAITTQAAVGELDHWASDPEGRLALIILLDQFSRSAWRDSPQAFAQDKAALAWVMEGLENGHYAALPAPWFKVVYSQPLGHCEGPDHLDRLDLLIRLRDAIAAEAPRSLQGIYQSLVGQAHDVRQVIATFGRYPHRNMFLERPSTPAEEAYIAEKRFPHLRAFQE